MHETVVSEPKRIWDDEARRFIDVESLVFTGPRAGVTLIPPRDERTSGAYDHDKITGLTAADQDDVERECACGCGMVTSRRANGKPRVYMPGHNTHRNNFNARRVS